VDVIDLAALSNDPSGELFRSDRESITGAPTQHVSPNKQERNDTSRLPRAVSMDSRSRASLLMNEAFQSADHLREGERKAEHMLLADEISSQSRSAKRRFMVIRRACDSIWPSWHDLWGLEIGAAPDAR
jgi:hypothetical protein